MSCSEITVNSIDVVPGSPTVNALYNRSSAEHSYAQNGWPDCVISLLLGYLCVWGEGGEGGGG